MAIVNAGLREKEKRATEDRDIIGLTDQFIIEVDDINDDQGTLILSDFPDLPKIDDAHPTMPNVTLRSREFEPTDSRFYWLCNVTWSDAVSPGEAPSGSGTINVLQVTVDKWDETFILEEDYSAQPKQIRNSAGDKLKFESVRPHVMITISSVTTDPAFDLFLQEQGKVNKNLVTWLGFSWLPGQLLFDEYKATSAGFNSWREDFVFKSKKVPSLESATLDEDRKAGWQAQILDAGFNELVERNGQQELVPILSRQKEGDKAPPRPVTQPWPLSGGEAIARDQFDQQREFLQFKTFLETPFNAIFHFDFESILTRNEQEDLGLR